VKTDFHPFFQIAPGEKGSALASSGYPDATREALAMHIIDLANEGERDVNRLRDEAVA
jgi:hypothetical protein